jgi:hypothetical protein
MRTRKDCVSEKPQTPIIYPEPETEPEASMPEEKLE